MSSLLSRLGFPSVEEMKPVTAIETVGTLDRAVAYVAEVQAPPPAVPEPPKDPVPIPEAALTPEAELDDTLRAKYAAVALELGVTQTGLLKDAARAYFRDRGTRLYDGAKVKAYLDDQYGKEKTTPDHQFHPPRERGLPTWCWRPLRAKDVIRLNGEQRQFGYNSPERNDSIWHHVEAYKKPVPLPVLLTAKEIATQFPHASMYVSDEVYTYEHRDVTVLDPFLLVVIEGERFIVERWDEPAYRE